MTKRPLPDGVTIDEYGDFWKKGWPERWREHFQGHCKAPVCRNCQGEVETTVYIHYVERMLRWMDDNDHSILSSDHTVPVDRLGAIVPQCGVCRIKQLEGWLTEGPLAKYGCLVLVAAGLVGLAGMSGLAGLVLAAGPLAGTG